ncbi:MAG: hypothetical protein HMLIMOIP_001873 [Candidatus Nitrosomirales archaeon]|jgi:hypothetical protein
MKKLKSKVDELEETVKILSDKPLLKSIAQGLDDLKKGRYKIYRSVQEMKQDVSSIKRKR